MYKKEAIKMKSATTARGCHHPIRFKGKKIIPEKDCPCCQANIKFLQVLTQEHITQEEYDQALKEYRQE